jgi:hypothetical protein
MPKYNNLEIANYSLITLDLSAAATNREIVLDGRFFCIQAITSGASVQIGFNDKSSQKFTFASQDALIVTYNKIYVTNSAQAGASVTLLLSTNLQYNPYDVKSRKVSAQVFGSVTLVTASVAQLLLPALDTRRSLVITNYSAASAVVYLGDATVTVPGGAAPTALCIPAGASMVFNTDPFFTGALYAVADTNTTQVAYWYSKE